YLLSIPVVAAILPLLKIPISFLGFGSAHAAIRLLSVSNGDWENAVTITAHRNFLKIFLSWQYLSFFIYIGGLFVLLISLVKSLQYINRIARQYPEQQINDILFFQTNEPGTPFSFFKKVFWNTKLNIESGEGQ